MGYLYDNRTHYTISQSTVWYDTQLTNQSLTTVIVFRCRNYSDSFFSYVHLFSDIPSNDNAFSIWAGFASDRIGRVYVHSTNMADMIFFHKTTTADNRTHYTISQSTVWYDTQLTNNSLTTVIVFRCWDYTDSFFSYVHQLSDILSNDNAFCICTGFASDRIGRVYVHSTNVADLIFFHKTYKFSYDYLAKLHSSFSFLK